MAGRQTACVFRPEHHCPIAGWHPPAKKVKGSCALITVLGATRRTAGRYAASGGLKRFLAGSLGVKKRVFGIKSVLDWVKSVALLIKSVMDLTPNTTGLIKSITDLTPSNTLLIKSGTDLIPIVSPFIKWITDLIPIVTDLTKSVADLVKSVTDLIKSITDLTHWTSNFCRIVDSGRMKTGHLGGECGGARAEWGLTSEYVDRAGFMKSFNSSPAGVMCPSHWVSQPGIHPMKSCFARSFSNAGKTDEPFRQKLVATGMVGMKPIDA